MNHDKLLEEKRKKFKDRKDGNGQQEDSSSEENHIEFINATIGKFADDINMLLNNLKPMNPALAQ